MIIFDWLRTTLGGSEKTARLPSPQNSGTKELEAQLARARQELYSEEYRTLVRLARETGEPSLKARAEEKKREAMRLHQEAQILEALNLLASVAEDMSDENEGD